MEQCVGLFGNPILQAKSLAKVLNIEETVSLGDLMALTRGCIIAVEESSKEEDYKIQITSAFEGTGKQFYVMNYINDIIEDILEASKSNGSVDILTAVASIENDCKMANPYIPKLKRKAQSFKGKEGAFEDLRDSEGRIDLTYLYTYQQTNSDVMEIYNLMFIAIKFNMIKAIEQKLAVCSASDVDCRNNSLTLTFSLDADSIFEFLSDVFTVLSSDELIATCLSNIKIIVPSDRDITFILPNIPESTPEYTDALYESDYIIYCESVKSVESNRAKFLSSLEEKMALAPNTKVDYILVRDDTLDDALIAKSLSSVSNIPSLKSLVGNVEDMEWVPEEGDMRRQDVCSRNSFFSHTGEQEDNMDLSSEPDSIAYTSSTVTLPTDRQTIDFNVLKQELTRVGISGFKGLKVYSWDEEIAPMKIDILPAKDVKTDILDDYDVARIMINGKELLMHYMESFDLDMIPLDYIKEHIKASQQTQSRETIQSISNDFTMRNVKAIENVLAQTKESLASYYANQSEKSIRNSYIKIVLSDICEELYGTLKQNIITQKFDCDIDGTVPNVYIGENIKITLLKVLYNKIVADSRKYWLRGIDEALKDPNQPNLPIIMKLLDELL